MRQHHPFLAQLANPGRCASGRDGSENTLCNQTLQDHLGRVQRHPYKATDPDHPSRCTQKSDYADDICFELKINHVPILRKSNPYLKTEANRIGNTMRKDLEIAEEILDSLQASESAQTRLGRQVWEARIKVLSVALKAIEQLSDD